MKKRRPGLVMVSDTLCSALYIVIVYVPRACAKKNFESDPPIILVLGHIFLVFGHFEPIQALFEPP